MSDSQTKMAMCHMCLYNCYIKATIEDGKVVKVEQHPELGALGMSYAACTRAPKALLEYTYHPDRLDYPLKRVGTRGEGKWERISWDQALDEIAAKIDQIRKQYGAEAIHVGTGTPRGTHSCHVKYTFADLLGTPNNTTPPGNFCYGPVVRAQQIIGGWGYNAGGDVNPERTKCYVMWAGNTDHSYMEGPPKTTARMRAGGCKTIVIDPRLTEPAEQADMWLRIRPGTDQVLAMAMLNTIIEEELYDKEFVQKWTVGFDKLRESVKRYPAEKAEEITWIPAETIKEAARMMANNTPTIIITGMGISQQGRPTGATLLYVKLIQWVTGSMDVPGGELLNGPAYMSYYEESMFPDALTDQQAMKQLGTDRFKLLGYPGYKVYREAAERYWKKPPCMHYLHQASWPMITRAILSEKPYPVKAVITNCVNYFFGYPNAKLTYEAVKSPNLELFVAQDIFMTPWTALADYVLPATTTFERPDLDHFWGFSNGLMSDLRTLPPTAERKDDYQLYRGIMERLGIKLPTYKGNGVIDYDDAISWPETLEGFYDWMLAKAQKPTGMSFEELATKQPVLFPELEFEKHAKTDPQTGQPRGFATLSGKAELAPGVLEKLGYDPLPDYDPPVDTPMAGTKLAEEYPFQMFCGPRNKYYFFSEQRQCPTLRREYPYPRVQIHPNDATKLCIADGEWVYIETPLGKIRQVAQVTTMIPEGIVHVEFDWWLPEMPAQEPWICGMWEVNGNVLLDDDPDKLGIWGGEVPNRATMCKVYKAPEYVKSNWMEKEDVTW